MEEHLDILAEGIEKNPKTIEKQMNKCTKKIDEYSLSFVAKLLENL